MNSKILCLIALTSLEKDSSYVHLAENIIVSYIYGFISMRMKYCCYFHVIRAKVSKIQITESD